MNPKRTSFHRPVLGLLVLAGATDLWANRDTWAADGEPRTPWQMNATPNPPTSRSSSGAPAGSWAAQQMEIQRVNQEQTRNRLRQIQERTDRIVNAAAAVSAAAPLVYTNFNRMDRASEPLPEPSYRSYTASSYTPPASSSSSGGAQYTPYHYANETESHIDGATGRVLAIYYKSDGNRKASTPHVCDARCWTSGTGPTESSLSQPARSVQNYAAAPVAIPNNMPAVPVVAQPPPAPTYSSEGHFVLEDDGVRWVGPYTGKRYKIPYEDIAKDANLAFRTYLEHEREYQRKAGVPVIPPNPSDDFRDEQIHAIDRATAYVEELKNKTNPPPPPKPVPPLTPEPPPGNDDAVYAWYVKNQGNPDAERVKARLIDANINLRVDAALRKIGEDLTEKALHPPPRPATTEKERPSHNLRYPNEPLYEDPASAPPEHSTDPNPKDQPYRPDWPVGRPPEQPVEESPNPWEEPPSEEIGPLSWLDQKKKEAAEWVRDSLKTHKDFQRKWEDPLSDPAGKSENSTPSSKKKIVTPVAPHE